METIYTVKCIIHEGRHYKPVRAIHNSRLFNKYWNDWLITWKLKFNKKNLRHAQII